MIPEPVHDSGCATCRTARCCVRFDPELTGFDLVRLVDGLGVAAGEVARLRPARAEQAGEDGAVLGPDGLTFLMCLTSRADGGEGPGARPCTLLVGLDAGRPRCGAYALRPMRCRTFPTERAPWGVVADNPDAICPPDAWSAARADLVIARLLHLRAEVEADLYRAFLARWNAAARSGPATRRSDAEAAFFAATLRAHRALAAAVAPELGDPRWLDRVAPAWLAEPTAARRLEPGHDPGAASVGDLHARARAVLDGL